MKPLLPSIICTRPRLPSNSRLLALCLLAASLPLDLLAQAPVTNALTLVEVVSGAKTNLLFSGLECVIVVDPGPTNGTVSGILYDNIANSFRASYSSRPSYAGDDYFA